MLTKKKPTMTKNLKKKVRSLGKIKSNMKNFDESKLFPTTSTKKNAKTYKFCQNWRKCSKPRGKKQHLTPSPRLVNHPRNGWSSFSLLLSISSISEIGKMRKNCGELQKCRSCGKLQEICGCQPPPTGHYELTMHQTHRQQLFRAPPSL